MSAASRAASRLVLTATLCFLAACSESAPDRRPEPFAAQADASVGLADVADDVSAVLEHGSLPGACDDHEAAKVTGHPTRRSELACGKEMFFYEGFGTLGVPEVLLDFLITQVSAVGPGARGVGLIEDPTSPARRPIGLARGSAIGGRVPTLAFSCASCHFARLPDGRYAAGAPNHDFAYGLLNLALTELPAMALGGIAGHDPLAVERIQPLLDELHAKPVAQLALLGALFQLVPALGNVPPITADIESALARWNPGTMDFLMAPTFIDDGVHTISKIPTLWGLPDAREVVRYRMHHAMLGSTGGTFSVESFLDGFVRLGGGDVAQWPSERLRPLAEYLRSLRAPGNPDAPDSALVQEGELLFASKGCLGCHDGARGHSRYVFAFDEIGTEDAMKRWMDAELDGKPCCGATLGPEDEITHGLKAPRLVGMWAQKRFLHNGSVSSLDDLFCRSGARPTIPEAPFSDRGHPFTCGELADSEKNALQAYLLAH